MNEVWKNIFKNFIKDYNAIQTLHKDSILDDESKALHEDNLLYIIIETFRSEVEE